MGVEDGVGLGSGVAVGTSVGKGVVVAVGTPAGNRGVSDVAVVTGVGLLAASEPHAVINEATTKAATRIPLIH